MRRALRSGVIFFTGLLLGAALGLWTGPRLKPWEWERSGRRERMMERFSAKLSLTPDQKTRVAKIFESKHERMAALDREVRPKFDAIRSSTREEIRALLTPEQQLKFDQIRAEHEKRRQKNSRPGDGPWLR